MFEQEQLRLSSYLDFEDFQRTCPGLLLVAFVNRNEPLAQGSVKVSTSPGRQRAWKLFWLFFTIWLCSFHEPHDQPAAYLKSIFDHTTCQKG
jgi:hypothetical protein